MSAYTLLDLLRENGFRAPLQVYRALEVLVRQGFVHRLESLNAFVASAGKHDDGHRMTAFAICDECGQVTELCDHAIERQLDKWVGSSGFDARKAVIEFRGRCGRCITASA